MRIAPSIRDIQHAVAAEFGFEPAHLTGGDISADVSRARHLAMTLARQLTGKSPRIIGEAFGRDRTTVLHAVSVTQQRLIAQDSFRHHAQRIRDALNQNRKTRPDGSLEGRLATLLCRIIDEPLTTLRDPESGRDLPIYLGSYRQDLAEGAAALLEEAGL